MKISARNQFSGKVQAIEAGAVNAIVTLDLGITGTISMAAVKELGLEVGKEAFAIIKATEVMVGIGEMKLSARNKLAGKITEISKGTVNSIVSIKAACGIVSATISNSAIKELGLEVGSDVVAVIKATSVMFGVN